MPRPIAPGATASRGTDREAVHCREADICKLCSLILDTSQCAVAIAGTDTRIRSVNRAFLSMWGYASREEVLERRAAEFWESRTIATNVYRALLRTGNWSGELIARRADGSNFRASVAAKMEYDPVGHQRLMVASFSDISEQVRNQESLYTENEKRRALLECTSDWIWEVNSRGVYVYSNPNVQDILGYSPDEVLGKTPFEFMPPSEAERARKIFAAHLEARMPFRNLENLNFHRDGREVVLETSGVPVTDRYGRFRGFRGIDRDITARKNALAALQQTRDELEATVERRTRALRQAYAETQRLNQNLDAVFSSISDAIITVDTDMRLVQSNQALSEVCSRADSMRIGTNLEQAFDQGEHSPCLHLLREVLREHKPIRGYRAQCHCGLQTSQVTMLNASPVWDSMGTFSGAVLVVRDVTHLDSLERSLDERSCFRHIIGKSRKIQDIFSILEQLKDLKTTVLITGESGTGKDMIVDALHYSSSTITGPLVKVNCSALAENLLESELFGHVKGAFTGAIQDKMGRFQAAEGGTIFLDEIGDISPGVQLKLLRVLESKEFEQVGDSSTQTADVRVVAATNANLHDKVHSGLFREDLYYRLRVMVVTVPPLRERTEDIPLLTEHFVSSFSRAFGKEIYGVTDEVMHAFMHYPWPGNIRELKHTIEHACILCGAGPLATHHLPAEIGSFIIQQRQVQPWTVDSTRAARDRYLAALKQSRWNKTRAAKMLGVSRTTLYRKMEEMDIRD